MPCIGSGLIDDQEVNFVSPGGDGHGLDTAQRVM